MSSYGRISRAMAAMALSLVVGAASNASVNKDIDIGDGQQVSGGSTVNGSITVGTAAIVSGSLDTVNGSVDIGDSVQLRSASTVNGSIRAGDGIVADGIESVNGTIRIGRSAQIAGSIEVVNGKVDVGTNSRVGGNIGNVNGRITVEGTIVEGDVSTVTGDVTLTAGTTVMGDLIIEEPGGWRWNRPRNKPRIIIGPNSSVTGSIVAEHAIELFLSDSAEVGAVTGEASLESAVRFSGDRP